jgi:hypothetical protein
LGFAEGYREQSDIREVFLRVAISLSRCAQPQSVSHLIGEKFEQGTLMSSSNLKRWCGMVAVVAGALSVAVDLVVLAVRGFGQSYGESLTSSGLLFRSVAAPLAGALVPLGLVGLYARQSEATGVPGLAGFLVAFVGTVLAQGSASPGCSPTWALFGVASLQARVYPRAASILLIVDAVGTAVAGAFPRKSPKACRCTRSWART